MYYIVLTVDTFGKFPNIYERLHGPRRALSQDENHIMDALKKVLFSQTAYSSVEHAILMYKKQKLSTTTTVAIHSSSTAYSKATTPAIIVVIDEEGKMSQLISTSDIDSTNSNSIKRPVSIMEFEPAHQVYIKSYAGCEKPPSNYGNVTVRHIGENYCIGICEELSIFVKQLGLGEKLESITLSCDKEAGRPPVFAFQFNSSAQNFEQQVKNYGSMMSGYIQAHKVGNCVYLSYSAVLLLVKYGTPSSTANFNRPNVDSTRPLLLSILENNEFLTNFRLMEPEVAVPSFATRAIRYLSQQM